MTLARPQPGVGRRLPLLRKLFFNYVQIRAATLLSDNKISKVRYT